MPLDLSETVSIPLTREEWAVVIFGLAALDHGPNIGAIAERLGTMIQMTAAPAGVLARTLVKNRPSGQ